MRRKTAYVFLSEEYADWEIALVMAGLHSFGGADVLTFSLTRDPVCSMGNLAVLADLTLEEVDPSDVDLLILPGSPLWGKGENRELIALIQCLLLLEKGVAAISGATHFLAREGFLNIGTDTEDAAARDGDLITAGAAHCWPFARAIFDYLGLSDNPDFLEWFQYFKKGEAVIRKTGVVSFV